MNNAIPDPKIKQINNRIQEKAEIVNKTAKGYPSQLISVLEISIINNNNKKYNIKYNICSEKTVILNFISCINSNKNRNYNIKSFQI